MVSLVGVGPGDFELMTVKAVNRLQNADVVLYDRLIGDEIISIMPESAKKIFVGKNAGRHPVPQDEINRLILSEAQKGRNVVRLKGGDPFIFGRGGEEAEALAENNIEFEVIPGISSSTTGAMYAGIPVTHRDYASSLHIITGHMKADGKLDIDFSSLVKGGGTLVFMMSVSSVGEISKGCIDAGMDVNTPAAIIENATSSKQRSFLTKVESLPAVVKENKVVSPSVIIIGKVCGLSEKLDWFSKKPLHNKSVLVMRTRKGSSKLTKGLKELGCGVIEMPCLRITPFTEGNDALKNGVSNISNYQWLVFTSVGAVDIFFDYLAKERFDIRRLNHMKIAVVGSETRKAVEKRGLFTDYEPEAYNGVALANGLSPLAENQRLLIPRAKIASLDMTNVFKAKGIAFDDIPLYDTDYEAADTFRLEMYTQMLKNKEFDYVTFTSSSTVEGFIKAFPHVDYSEITAVCIGEITADAARTNGFHTIVSKEATIESMLEEIVRLSNDK